MDIKKKRMDASDEQRNAIAMTSSTAATPSTISIVIPLSGPLSILPNCITAERLANDCDVTRDNEVNKKGEKRIRMENEMELKRPEEKDSLTNAPPAVATARASTNTKGNKQQQQQQQQRPDKTKGCPFPTCSRYGRAFSRAHDLKRHIARHETRKERLVETNREDIRTCCQCGENFLNDTILERHARTAHSVPDNKQQQQLQQQQNEFRPLTAFMPTLSILSNGHQQSTIGESCPLITYYSCNICKKKYTSENKLNAHHLSAHENKQKAESKLCQFCNCHFDNDENLQNHIREEHTTSILQVHEVLSRAKDKLKRPFKEEKVDNNGEGVNDGGNNEADDDDNDDDDDDEFMLEEMLLLKKNPRINHVSSIDVNNAVVGSNATAAITSASVSSFSSSSSSITPNNHNKNKNNNNNNNKIRCDYCSKTFKTKWTLSSHVAAHEGRFQFCCTRCGKKFVRKSHFEGHVRSHEAARPYVCEQCGKTFKELKHRREHTKRKHHPDNQNAIQNLLDSISACVSEDSSVDQAKFTLLMPINFDA